METWGPSLLHRQMALWRCAGVLLARRRRWALSEHFLSFDLLTQPAEMSYTSPTRNLERIVQALVSFLPNWKQMPQPRCWTLKSNSPQLFLNFGGGNKAPSCVCHFCLQGQTSLLALPLVSPATTNRLQSFIPEGHITGLSHVLTIFCLLPLGHSIANRVS